MRRASIGSSFVAACVLASVPATAQDVAAVPPTHWAPPAPSVDAEPPPEPERAAPSSVRRIFGAGTAIGAGIAGGGVYAPGLSARFTNVSVALELPSIELLFFVDDHFSVDLTLPVANTGLVAPFGVFAWSTNLFLDFSVGDDWVRFIVGPDVGFAVATGFGIEAGQINVGALVGVELLTVGRGFGFRVMSRPQAQFALREGDSAFAIGGTALLELAFIGYAR